MNEKNEFQTKTLGEKLYNLLKSMKKAKAINSIINKSMIAIIVVYLACMLYLFALNGRYKPIGNSEYGLYKDTWTGKIHSAFMEYGKNAE